ncbi:NUDIX domain-containing protein [Streptomyces rimosus]|uniref:NUDIX domain-containing protein n=1 Tax=Streptomyces rimosus TaxID=1927 RepID=UPI0004CC22EE|nr:NUDIX domain-containing protein [Streptomyces rimosus]
MHKGYKVVKPPPVRIGGQGLLTDAEGRTLTVRPTYAEDPDHSYQLAGGHALENEWYGHAAVREVDEETGLSLSRGRLLVIDFIGAKPPSEKDEGRAAGYNFVLDFGTVPADAEIRLPAPSGAGESPELDHYLFLADDELEAHCQDYMVKRILWAKRARVSGRTAELRRGELVAW